MMKHPVKSIISLILCICLFAGIALPAGAANESNNQGVTFSATLDNPTLYASDQSQTVVMTVNASQGVSLAGIGGTVIWDNPLMLTAVENSDSRIDFTGKVTLSSGTIAWDGTTALELLADVTNIAVVTFTVPANTPAGTYEVGIKDIELTDNLGDAWETSAAATATLTIVEPSQAADYNAGLTTGTSSPQVGETVTVNVNVSHSANQVFASSQVELSYDNTKLTFNESASTLNGATVTDSNGTLKLADYGADQNVSNGSYALVFTAIADGMAEVELTFAAFSDKVNAVTEDLSAATLSPAAVTFTVNKASHQVTLPSGFEGSATVVSGADYTFTVVDDKYTYSNIQATVGGNTATVIDNNNGTYTVNNVTGALVITATATPKEFDVVINGETASNGGTTATYNTDYSFTLKDNVAASQTAGTNYSLSSVTIAGQAYTDYSVSGRTYTIPGADITGKIVITVTATPVEPNQFAVQITGNGAGDATGAAAVDKDATYTLTLTPETGYSYTVTATMGGSAAAVNQSGNTYTVENVTGKLVFTVTKTVVTTGVSVQTYLTVQGQSMFLVKYTGTVASGKVPTYADQPMFWSEVYNCYCYVVFAETLPEETVKANIGIATGTADAYTTTLDVNESGKIDANDAQLVYNMYQTGYNEFTNEVTAIKFLKADVNGDGVVNISDAVMIINSVLGVSQ